MTEDRQAQTPEAQKRAAQTPRVLEFWFEFASTYSYLAAARIEAACRAAHVPLRWRPFLLGPIFAAQGWTTSPFTLYPAKGRYMWRDMERLCAAQNLPFRRPRLFPQNSVHAARIALLGAWMPWGPAFVRAVYAANFAEDRDISTRETLIALLDGLGLDGQALYARAQTQEIKDRLRAQTEEAASRGIFGAPSFLVGEELFWGNDRLDQAIAYAASGATGGAPSQET